MGVLKAAGCRARSAVPGPAQRWLDAITEPMNLQAYYSIWFDVLPDGLRDTPTALALRAIIDLDLHELAGIVPPRGCRRD